MMLPPVSRVDVDHLAETAGFGVNQHVGKKKGEGLIADELARAPDGVAQSQGLLLAGEARVPGYRKAVRQNVELGSLAAAAQRLLEFELPIEMILDRRLAAAGHEDEMLDARLARLLDDHLDHRPVDDGEHLLRHRLGRRQKSCSKAGYGKYGLSDPVLHRGCNFPVEMTWSIRREWPL